MQTFKWICLSSDPFDKWAYQKLWERDKMLEPTVGEQKHLSQVSCNIHMHTMAHKHPLSYIDIVHTQ